MAFSTSIISSEWIRWGSANFFYKGSNDKYLTFGGNRVAVVTHLPSQTESGYRRCVNNWAWLCANNTLLTGTKI